MSVGGISSAEISDAALPHVRFEPRPTESFQLARVGSPTDFRVHQETENPKLSYRFCAACAKAQLATHQSFPPFYECTLVG